MKFPIIDFFSKCDHRSNHWCFVKKVFLENFAILTGKQLCWSVFFNKVAGFQAFFLSNHADFSRI